MSTLDQLTGAGRDVRTRMWQAARDLVRNAPTIRSMDPLFQVPESTAFDDPPPEARLTIRMSPAYEDMGDPLASNGIRSVYPANVLITFLIACPGQRAETSQAVWREILAAIRGDRLDNAALIDFKAALLAEGIHDAVPIKNPDSLAGGTVGEGSIRLVGFLTL
jgi:hypothetical protein